MTDASPGPAGGRPGTPGVHDRVVDLEQQAEQPGADVLSIADELTAVSGQTSAVDYAAAIGPQQAAVDLLRSFTPTGDQATRYRRDYALALNTLVSRLFDAGQKGVALTTAAAATAAYSTAGESPDANKLGLSVQLTLLVKLLSGSSPGPEGIARSADLPGRRAAVPTVDADRRGGAGPGAGSRPAQPRRPPGRSR